MLFRMGMANGASGYKAEKLAIVRDGLEAWFSDRKWAGSGNDATAFREHLLLDIEHLRKALARGSGGQD